MKRVLIPPLLFLLFPDADHDLRGELRGELPALPAGARLLERHQGRAQQEGQGHQEQEEQISGRRK